MSCIHGIMLLYEMNLLHILQYLIAYDVIVEMEAFLYGCFNNIAYFFFFINIINHNYIFITSRHINMYYLYHIFDLYKLIVILLIIISFPCINNSIIIMFIIHICQFRRHIISYYYKLNYTQNIFNTIISIKII